MGKKIRDATGNDELKLKTMWPKSMARGRWTMKDSDTLLAAGKVKNGKMEVSLLKAFSVKGQRFEARALHDAIVAESDRWRMYPYSLIFKYEDQVPSPFRKVNDPEGSDHFE